MFKSKKWWDEVKEKYKNVDLEPLEIIPLEEQNKQAKELEKEDRLLLWQMKYQKGEKYD